ncbi:MAG: FAD:protein FMN transferase [Opitutales bacterium]
MEDNPIIHNFSHEAFGSRFWVRIAAEDGVYARNAAEALFQLLDDLDFQTDRRHDSGPVTAINQMPEGAMVAASEHVQALWNFSKDVSADTGKAFDATAGALFSYWKSRGDLPFNPDDQAWNQVISAYREGEFRLDGCELTCVKFGCAVDFGAIVRGYALDRMADMLESSWGIHRALLMASGSVTLALDPPGESAGWRIGVGANAEIKLCRFAMASKTADPASGNLVDPRTGQVVALPGPVRAIATSALEAEGLAMAAAVLNASEAEEFVNRGCSRGLWLPDGTKLGSVTYFEVAERPAPEAKPTSSPEETT